MIATAKQHVPAWHSAFLSLLPAILGYARRAFGGLPAEAREEALQEVAANCLVAYARLVELDKEDVAYPSVLARYAVAQIRSGRRVGSSVNSRDVYSESAQARGNFLVQHLGTPRDQRGSWQEQVTENYVTPVPDQAAFRIDFPAWLSTLNRRDRRIALALAKGERTQDVARQKNLSPSRVSQLRRELAESWAAFHGEEI